MFGISNLSAFVIGAIAIILLPGPNSMYCLTVAGRYGVRAAYRVVAGILLGDALLILATVLGAGTLLELYPALFDGIRLIGGLYLAYLGYGLIRAAVQKWHKPVPRISDGNDTPSSPPQHIFSRALMLSLTNPKAILFFLSFFVPFVDPSYDNPTLSFAVLALILQSISFIYLNILIVSGCRLTQAFLE